MTYEDGSRSSQRQRLTGLLLPTRTSHSGFHHDLLTTNFPNRPHTAPIDHPSHAFSISTYSWPSSHLRRHNPCDIAVCKPENLASKS